MVGHASNSSIQEAKAGGSWIWDQSRLYNEFRPAQGYTAKPYHINTYIFFLSKFFSN
jgi:hypothetical protein